MAAETRYLVRPGTVFSENDGDLHYIDAPTLMRLYGVNPAECWEYRRGSYNPIGLIELKPRSDGCYTLIHHAHGVPK